MAIYLLVNGMRVAPRKADHNEFLFHLNLPAEEIRLVSGQASPADIDGTPDRRRLGVAVQGMRWQQGETVIETPIRSPAFIDGFHGVERYDINQQPYRWTNGDAAIPPDLFPSWHGETLLHLDLTLWAGSTVSAPRRPAATLLSAFENLGDNCEFALAQRHYGVEPPLTLLRWAGTTYEKLSRGLRMRFEGLGDPRSTEVVWDSIDYRLHTPYLNFHTNVDTKRDAAGVAEILNLGCATLRLLRRKLLTDIASARRIFVFRTEDLLFGPEEMHRLHAALRAIGPVTLLCVTLKPSGQTGGRATRLADGLYAGHLERFVIPDGPFDEWLALCSRVVALRYAER